MKQSASVVLGVSAMVALAQPASAETFKFLTNLGIQQFSAARDAVLNDKSGATIIKFKVKKRGTIVVTFSASCYVTGPDGARATVLIYVKQPGKPNFSALPPTYSGNIFCSTVAGSPGLVTGVAIGGDVLPAGQHQLKVTVEPFNGAVANLRGSALRIED